MINVAFGAEVVNNLVSGPSALYTIYYHRYAYVVLGALQIVGLPMVVMCGNGLLGGSWDLVST